MSCLPCRRGRSISLLGFANGKPGVCHQGRGHKSRRENGRHVRGIPQASGEKTARFEIITVRVPGFARSTN